VARGWTQDTLLGALLAPCLLEMNDAANCVDMLSDLCLALKSVPRCSCKLLTVWWQHGKEFLYCARTI
jgi:hypothetical protein